VLEDFERCYRAVSSRDPRFDGWFFTAVTSTGIYCRPSCPARTPTRRNVRFYPSAAAAQQAGFRACMRCRPDAAPGSPEWNVRADVVARAMRLIADGTVDRGGVAALATRLGYSERQIHRLLVAEVGTGALALARAQRAQTARLLIETTDLPVADVAFTAGFASVRQFNDTFRAVFAASPSEVRRKHRGPRREREHGTGDTPVGASVGTPTGVPSGAKRAGAGTNTLVVRLAYREPCDAAGTIAFLGARAIPGVERCSGETYNRTLRLPHGPGSVSLSPDRGYVRAVLGLEDLRDLTAAVNRCRRLLDLDSDPSAVDDELGRDPLLAPSVASTPGVRIPGTVDCAELAVRAVIGQQVSVAGARTVAGHLVSASGTTGCATAGGPDRLFPTPEEILNAGDAALRMPAARRRTVQALALALAQGDLVLDPAADPSEVDARLRDLPGIGPWTAGYIRMRGLGDPDTFLPTDLGVRRALATLGRSDDPVAVARRWRPWRAYATVHLWSMATGPAAAGSRNGRPDSHRKESAA
jgi:AraC family transcriptional regulator, regulatory protein of adaptative response / DNA-3-methyladenine glycosylase II